jgi:hypothetical protein
MYLQTTIKKYLKTGARCLWLTSVILLFKRQRSRGSQFEVARANSSPEPILKSLSQKRAGGVAQGIDPEFKLSTTINKQIK